MYYITYSKQTDSVYQYRVSSANLLTIEMNMIMSTPIHGHCVIQLQFNCKLIVTINRSRNAITTIHTHTHTHALLHK